MGTFKTRNIIVELSVKNSSLNYNSKLVDGTSSKLSLLSFTIIIQKSMPTKQTTKPKIQCTIIGCLKVMKGIYFQCLLIGERDVGAW